VTGDCHARFCGSRGARLPPATRLRQAQIDDGEREGTTSDDRARISELEAELARVKRERELLKRTVAFWVKETSTP
jgi:transposase-like protein